MNDVRVNGVDSAIRQGSAASSNSTAEQTPSSPSSTPTNVSQVAPVQVSQSSDVLAENLNESQVATQEAVEQAVTQLNDFVQSVQRDLQFSLDDDSGRTIVTVVDRQTSEVVRQIPDEVAVRLAQDLQQDEPLTLFSTRV